MVVVILRVDTIDCRTPRTCAITATRVRDAPPTGAVTRHGTPWIPAEVCLVDKTKHLRFGLCHLDHVATLRRRWRSSRRGGGPLFDAVGRESRAPRAVAPPDHLVCRGALLGTPRKV